MVRMVRLKVSLMLVLTMLSRVSRLIFRMFSRMRSHMTTVSLTENPTMVSKAGDDREIKLVIGQHQCPHRHQHIVNQRNDGADAEPELKRSQM